MAGTIPVIRPSYLHGRAPAINAPRGWQLRRNRAIMTYVHHGIGNRCARADLQANRGLGSRATGPAIRPASLRVRAPSCARCSTATTASKPAISRSIRCTKFLEPDPDVLQARFTKHAPRAGHARPRNARSRTPGIGAQEMDALLISTCTGYLCPGLTSYVSERLGLRPDALLLDLVGQGCGAALPNLRAGEALLASGVAAGCCRFAWRSAARHFIWMTIRACLISACLFGDGAGAAVLVAEPKAGARAVKWNTSRTMISAKDRDLLRFEHARRHVAQRAQSGGAGAGGALLGGSAERGVG